MEAKQSEDAANSLNAATGETGLSNDNFDIFVRSNWFKDESLEDSANLLGLNQSRVPGFPRHTQSLGASRRKAGSRLTRAASAGSRHHRHRN
jgi:hypothetical protein